MNLNASSIAQFQLTPEEALQRGWSIIPVGLDKKPLISSWKPFQERRPTAEEVEDWKKLNPPAWAVITGAVSGIVTIDFDLGRGGDESYFKLQVRSYESGLDLAAHRRTGSGGYHIDVVHPGWRVRTLQSDTPRAWSEHWPGIDVRGDGGYAVFAGRNERGPYAWLRDADPYHAADILPVDLLEALGLARPPAEEKSEIKPPRSVLALPNAGRVGAEVILEKYLRRAAVGSRNSTWAECCAQLRDNGYSQAAALTVGESYAASVPQDGHPYSLAEMRATVASIYRMAARAPWARQNASEPPPRHEKAGTTADALEPAVAPSEPEPRELPAAEIPDLRGFRYTEYGNAERLHAMYGQDFHWCYEMQKWLVWDGRRWSTDSVDCMRKMALLTMRQFGLQAARLDPATQKAADTWARRSESRNAISAMIDLARSIDGVSVTAAELDQDPYLLNFLNGTVDLKTGVLRPRRRADLITKLVRYDYRPKARCPRFLAFLDRVMGIDPDAGQEQNERAARLVDYLQKALGYSLTGCTGEKAVFVPFGRKGNNGKTTLLTIFRSLLSEYSVLLQIDTLMVKAQAESSNTVADLADLRGARFVMTSEAEEGHRLQQGKLKRITQGMGRIKACRKYENPIEFDETHKLWMDTNRLPSIRDVDDEATWSRLHAIPFEVQIPPGERDKNFGADLIRKEAEGILAWAVAGAVRWEAEGLGRPPEIDRASREWRDEVDQLGRFLDECTEPGVYFTARSRDLYDSYKRWAEDAREFVMNLSVFGTKLAERGIEKQRDKQGFYYTGLKVVSNRRSEEAVYTS